MAPGAARRLGMDAEPVVTSVTKGGVAEGFGAGEMITAAAGVVVTLLWEGSVLETTDQTFENRRDPALGWSTPLL